MNLGDNTDPRAVMKNYLLINIFCWIATRSLCEESAPIYTYDITSIPSRMHKYNCDERSYQCNDGSCIPEKYYCNGMIDCEAGEDERNCRTCPVNFCPCSDGLCIHISSRCNGKMDCIMEGEDEQNCYRKKIPYDADIRTEMWNFYPADKQCTFERDDRFETGRLINMKLDCSNMKLVSIPCISDTIIILILNSNELGLLSSSLLSLMGYNYNNLRILELEKNHIEDLPSKIFENMRHLRELSLANNQVPHLNGMVFPSELERLHLQNNKIKNLPPMVFKNLNRLNDLSLAYNQIEYLDDDIFSDLHKLQELNLTQNLVRMLGPNTCRSLVNLKIFDISHNRIDIIVNKTFQNGCKNLRELYLNFNNVTKLEEGMFRSQNYLEELLLQHNQISVIGDHIFSESNRLKTLDLSHNKLTQLGSETFRNLIMLHSLRLNDNHIVRIHDDAFGSMTSLVHLFINRNKVAKLFRFPRCIYGQCYHITFDISENGIEEIKMADIPFEKYFLGNLSLQRNKLKTLKCGMFNRTKIKYLTLNNNQISTIEDHAFNGLRGVESGSIFLNSNNIVKITSRMFEGISGRWESLFLNDNKITTVEDYAFRPIGYLELLDLSTNALYKLTTNMFRGMKELYNITLQNNQIESIEGSSFNEMKYLKIINLSNNRLAELRSDMFRGSYALTRLYLQSNKIENIETNVFFNLTKLVELNLSDNRLNGVRSDMFRSLPDLQELHLQINKIRSIDINIFHNLTGLLTLDLSDNMIVEVKSNTFEDLQNLKTLSMGRNGINNIQYNAFKNLKSLMTLDLSDNRIISLPPNVLLDAKKLSRLYLQNNEIKIIDEVTFSGLITLSTLNLKNNEIGDVNSNIFKDLSRLQHLIADEYRFCCLKNNIKKCEAPRDEFSSCEDLMKNSVLRTFVWILGITSIFVNSFVIFFRIKYQSANTNQVNAFLIINLAMSDLFMGVYLLIIATTDTVYRGEYYIHDKYWRESYWCNFAGFLSTFSSELTVFILTILSVDRLYTVSFPIRARQRGIKRTKHMVMIVWILAAIISSLPLPFFNIHYFENFYGRSGVCLALHVTNDTPTGWQYSVLVFIVLNAILFGTIALCYFSMFVITIRARRSITSSNQTNDASIAFRMTLLVMADAACWIPIITLGIRSLMGINPSPQVYPWIAVFVLPLNAALNPILYTISSIPLVIKVKFPNTRLNGRLGFRWPFYWIAANKTRNS